MLNYCFETHWFAVQAKPGRERMASSRLGSQGMEVFFPEIKETRPRANIAQRRIRPLFTGYFFARFCLANQLDGVRYAPGVLRVVGTHGTPTPVAEEIIQSVRALVTADGYARLAPTPLRPGDLVCVDHGPLEGTIARVEQEWDDGRRVAILLDTIQRARVLIDRKHLVLQEV